MQKLLLAVKFNYADTRMHIFDTWDTIAKPGSTPAMNNELPKVVTCKQVKS